MAIFIGSRYAQEGRMLGLEDENGRVRRFVYTRRKFTREDLNDRFNIHTVQEGDRLDELANRFGGNARKWWLIADVNDLTDFPDDLIPGQQLIMPLTEVFNEIG